MQLGLIDAEDVDELTRTIRSRRSFDSVPLRLRMSDEDVGALRGPPLRIPGLRHQDAPDALLPQRRPGVHALGYVGAISEQDLQHIDRAAYSGTALIGKLGVEAAYEKQLHGANGFREMLVNAQGPLGREVRAHGTRSARRRRHRRATT